MVNVTAPADPVALPLSPLSFPLSEKIFTAKVATFSLKSDPSVLPDSLLQMAQSRLFIPLSMLTMSALNRIETNQNVKYKCLTYGLGIGKTFLDEMS